MKEVVNLFKKKPLLGFTATGVAGALGMYGIYSLSEILKQNADVDITREGAKKHIPYETVANAKDATAGRTIKVVATGNRPKADASGAKAGEDLIVTANDGSSFQPNTTMLENRGENDNKNEAKMRR